MSLPEPKAPSSLTVIASAVALVDMIRDSGVLRPAHLAKLGPILQLPRTADQLAEELVRMGALTTYQAERLLRDRAADLVLGPYVILDRVGKGQMGQGSMEEVRQRRQPAVPPGWAQREIRPQGTTAPSRPDRSDRIERDRLI